MECWDSWLFTHYSKIPMFHYSNSLSPAESLSYGCSEIVSHADGLGPGAAGAGLGLDAQESPPGSATLWLAEIRATSAADWRRAAGHPELQTDRQRSDVPAGISIPTAPGGGAGRARHRRGPGGRSVSLGRIAAGGGVGPAHVSALLSWRAHFPRSSRRSAGFLRRPASAQGRRARPRS